MKRREALKSIGLTAGFLVATPSLISLFQSCKSDPKTWVPVFLSENQGIIIRNIVDVILPKSDTPSASEVNVPEFIDKYYNEVLDNVDQSRLITAFTTLESQIKKDYNENSSEVTEENYKHLLDNHMLLNIPATDKEEPMTISDLLNNFKDMAIKSYKISELVGETILAYDPVPGSYYCGDLQELTQGKAWSL